MKLRQARLKLFYLLYNLVKDWAMESLNILYLHTRDLHPSHLFFVFSGGVQSAFIPGSQGYLSTTAMVSSDGKMTPGSTHQLLFLDRPNAMTPVEPFFSIQAALKYHTVCTDFERETVGIDFWQLTTVTLSLASMLLSFLPSTDHDTPIAQKGKLYRQWQKSPSTIFFFCIFTLF